MWIKEEIIQRFKINKNNINDNYMSNNKSTYKKLKNYKFHSINEFAYYNNISKQKISINKRYFQ